MVNTIPLKALSASSQTYADTVLQGPIMLPSKVIETYSDKQWEEFVLEWAHCSLVKTYALVEHCGGPGDMGRDIIAFPDDKIFDTWDSYQCKHYNHPLVPSDIWLEVGKLVYYTYCKEFSYPSNYYFVAPQGVGTKLGKLMKNPDELKKKLISNWKDYCSKKITSIKEVKLDETLKAYIEELDFSIIKYIPPLIIIDQHRTTPYYALRFGGGLPPRPNSLEPPQDPAECEVIYLQKLFQAYSDHLKLDVRCVDDINKNDLKEHCIDARIEFYSAESLRTFSRDTLPLGSYENLQDEVYSGISDVIREDHEDGYRRVLAVVKAAKLLQISSHPLINRMVVRDRGGICHQLANEKDNVKWVK